MPGQRPLLAMGFIASLGITFDVLACVLPKGDANFWPMIVFVTYLLLPLPYLFSKKVIKETLVGMNDSSSGRVRDFAVFFTGGLLVSSMALPILLSRTPMEKPMIAPISCILVEMGNLLCYATIVLFCAYNKPT